MWKIFFDPKDDKWVVGEFSRSLLEDDLAFHWRRQAEMSCARRNGIVMSNQPFWSEEEGDSYE